MLRLFLLCFVFVLFAGATSTWAEDSGVEINLETLDSYTPPPMFETAPPALPPPEVDKQRTYVAVPIPSKKPKYVPSREPDIEESQLVIQTAYDILQQIEGDDFVPPAPAPKASEKEPVQKVAPPAKVKDLTTLGHSGAFELSLPYEGEETALTEQQKKIINREILLRLLKFENTALEVRAYAPSDKEQDSPARRASLERALAIKSFLTEKNIASRRIYIRPLGKNTPNAQKNAVELSITAL